MSRDVKDAIPGGEVSETCHLEIRPSRTIALEEKENPSERLMGPSGMSEIIINIAVLAFYAILLSIPFVSFAFVSGGMRWILVVGTVTAIGLYTVYVMNRGIQKREFESRVKDRILFSGELSRVNDIVQRGSVGYSYSQYLMREMIAEALITRIRLGRGMTSREIENVLETPDRFRDIVGDEEMADFILGNWKKAEGWSDRVSRKKNDAQKKESAQRFMLEIDEILKKAEAWE